MLRGLINDFHWRFLLVAVLLHWLVVKKFSVNFVCDQPWLFLACYLRTRYFWTSTLAKLWWGSLRQRGWRNSATLAARNTTTKSTSIGTTSPPDWPLSHQTSSEGSGTICTASLQAWPGCSGPCTGLATNTHFIYWTLGIGLSLRCITDLPTLFLGHMAHSHSFNQILHFYLDQLRAFLEAEVTTGSMSLSLLKLQINNKTI